MDLISATDVHKARFMEIVRYYNDVVMSNTLIVGESEILKYQKKVYKIGECRKKFLKIPPPSKLESKSEFYTYLLSKNEHLQSDLKDYNKQLTYFYTKNKCIYDSLSILLVFLSSSLTLIQGILICFQQTKIYSQIIVLVISTSMTVITSTMKLKNFKGQLEDIVKAKEQVHGCQAKIYTFDKDLKSTIFLYNDTNRERDVQPENTDDGSTPM